MFACWRFGRSTARKQSGQRTWQGGLVLVVGGALALAFVSGCGRDRGPERVVVSGTVTYQGELIGEGCIRFMPTTESLVPMAGAWITDGKYKIAGRGGVPVGTHKVEIEGYRINMKALRPGQPVPQSAMEKGAPRVQYLPKRHNAESKLQFTIESGSRAITKNFALTD